MNKKKIVELVIPENDAENFRRSENRQLFNHLFVAKEYLEQIINPGKYFLIGEKGTGKTAYAVYLANNNYKETFSTIKYIRETEYAKFIEMKKSKNLQLSDYEAVWKVLLLLLVSQEVHNVCRTNLWQKIKNLTAYQEIKKLIDEFTGKAFTPELLTAMNLIDDNEFVLKLKAMSIVDAEQKMKTTSQLSSQSFSLSLLEIESKFKKAISQIKLGKNYILFIDGIDIRPTSISQEDYVECLKGLTNAIWNLNQDFFACVKDRAGFNIKIVLLIRPDIFMAMDLQNQSTKIHNNSVVLSWLTTYQDYRNSKLFQLADKILTFNNDVKEEEISIGKYFDDYFPYKVPSKRAINEDDPSFVGFLRFSFYRARDIVTLLDLMKKNVTDPHQTEFKKQNFDNIQAAFSHYLWMEIRDYFKFYYKDDDFDFLRNFLVLFNENVRFKYEYFEEKYNYHIGLNPTTLPPQYAKTVQALLQFLYELNIIGYVEYNAMELPRVHWCFRERYMSNPTPNVKLDAQEYRIHHGLHAALKIEQGYNKGFAI